MAATIEKPFNTEVTEDTEDTEVFFGFLLPGKIRRGLQDFSDYEISITKYNEGDVIKQEGKRLPSDFIIQFQPERQGSARAAGFSQSGALLPSHI